MGLYYCLDFIGTLTEALFLYTFNHCFLKQPRFTTPICKWITPTMLFALSWLLTWFSELGAYKTIFLIACIFIVLKLCYKDSIYQMLTAMEIWFMSVCLFPEAMGMAVATWIYGDGMIILVEGQKILRWEVYIVIFLIRLTAAFVSYQLVKNIRYKIQLKDCFTLTFTFLIGFSIYILVNYNYLNLSRVVDIATSYARADSITRKSPSELRILREAGLNHIYSGIETGSDQILKLINKGFNADTAVKSGCMAKEADMILSEFILLGIGGKELSEENATRTAEALNVIRPDFIRVHATGIKPESKMGEFVREGSFTLQSEEEIMIEQKRFLQQLKEMDSYYVNEHIINLLLEVRGNLRTDKEKMLSDINRFLNLPANEKLLFVIGRRFNIFFMLDDLNNQELHKKAEGALQKILNKNPEVDFTVLCNYIRQSQI